MKQVFYTLLIILLTAQVGFCAYDAATGEEIKGYKGTLPEVTERFQKFLPQSARPKFDSVDAFNKSTGYKPIPRDNPAYINVIIKKDKMSEFANDINYVIPIVEKVIWSIKNDENEQMFAARANSLYDNAEYVRRKYADKPEKYYPAYNSLIAVSNRTKSIVSIRNEAKVYSAYLPYQSEGYMYNPEYINNQLQYLLQELDNTLELMKEVD